MPLATDGLRDDAGRRYPAHLDPAGAAAPDGPPLSREAALRYLRDPSLRHWVAENSGRVYGHLVAHVHYRHAGPPTMVVSEFGVLPEHRDGMIGTELVGALKDEAVRLAASEVIALARGPAAAAHLRRFGFATRLRARRDHSSTWLLARISS